MKILQGKFLSMINIIKNTIQTFDIDKYKRVTNIYY